MAIGMTADIIKRFEMIEGEIAAMRTGMGDLTSLMAQHQIIVKALEEQRHQLESDVEDTLNAFTEMHQRVDQLSRGFHEKLGRSLDQERAKFGQWASSTADTLASAIQQSIGRSIPSALSGSMGVGSAGDKFGKTIGLAAGRAIGMMIAGPAGAMIGAQIGSGMVSTVLREVETIMTGPRVVGARLAPTIGGGRLISDRQEFERLGLGFMNTTRRISQMLRVGADEITDYASALARVGVGYERGGSSAVAYAIATERVLALQPQTVLKLQTDAVARYGDAVGEVEAIINAARRGMREFTALNLETTDSIRTSITAGQTYIDLLSQISAQGANSGASLRALHEMAGAIVKTMATSGPGGGASMRPGQMAAVGSNVFATLLPRMSSDWGEEARRSGMSRRLLETTEYGREYAKRVMAAAPESLRRNPMFTFQMAEQSYMTQGRKQGMQGLLAKMSGVYAEYRGRSGREANLLAAGRLVETMGGTPMATKTIIDTAEAFQRDMGVKLDKWSPNLEKTFMQWQRVKQSDPAYRERLREMGSFGNIIDAATEQGQAGKTSMDRVADVFDSLRGGLTNYWANWKQATAEVFGLDTGGGVMSSIGKGAMTALGALSTFTSPGTYMSIAGSAERELAASRSGSMGVTRFGVNPPQAETSTTVISKETAKGLNYELGTRDSNIRPR